MGFFSVLFLAALLQFHVASGSLCTNQCDATKKGGNLITFCGSDGNTYTTHQEATEPPNYVNSDCYSVCGVGIVHIGRCGCPNDCFNDTGNGVCDVKGKGGPSCKCTKNYRGADCSLPDCDNHKCTGHGKCKSSDEKKGGDHCECEHGWTGWDCSVQIPQILIDQPSSALPFGEYAGDNTPYFKNDKYGDKHPMFNTSALTLIKLKINDDDLTWMMDPENKRTDERKEAKMWFDNGAVSTYSKVEIRIKGLTSRMMQKKSFTLRFADDAEWKDMTGFGLKIAHRDMASIWPLVWEIYRSAKVQSYRTSISTLFINDWYYGVMIMHERTDENFLKSRYDAEDANLYELGQNFYLQYWGAVATPYKNYAPTTFDGIPTNAIVQDSGNGLWNDLTTLTTVLNGTQAEGFLPKYFNTKQWIRTLSADLFSDNSDTYYGTGNNYILINLKPNDDEPYWVNVAYDFDGVWRDAVAGVAGFLGIPAQVLRDMLDQGITTIGGWDMSNILWVPNPYMVAATPKRPLGQAIFNLPGSNDTLTESLEDLLTRTLFTHPGLLNARRTAFYNLTRTITSRDKMYTLAMGNSFQGTFEANFNVNTPAWMEQRWGYLASMIIARGNGQCTHLGVCTCNPGWSGPTCRQQVPPTPAPTQPPTPTPTQPPTLAPTPPPTQPPTLAPTQPPTLPPTQPPTLPPTQPPTLAPTLAPTPPPTQPPTLAPTQPPTPAATQPPTPTPTPTQSPTQPPTCGVSVAVQKRAGAGWFDGAYNYQQYDLVVTNRANKRVTDLKVTLTPSAPATVDTKWNMQLSSSPSTYAVSVFWDLQRVGDVSQQAGFTLKGTSNHNVAPAVAVASVSCS